MVPTESNFDEFCEGSIEKLIDSGIKKALSQADYRIFNLECPLYDGNTPIPKIGPNLAAPVSTINGILKFKPSLLGFSNNHILDHGDEGLFSTMTALRDNNTEFIGAGENLQEATRAYVFELNGIRVGIYACAENEFSIAGKNKPGANPFDPLESLDHISSLKKTCDYVVVLYHGGKEHYRYPSPCLQKICRKIAEKGADLVLCQHSHCIGCYEEYKGSTILFGQGNFLFDRSESEFWQTSLLVLADFDVKMTVKYLPICKDGSSVRMSNDEEVEKILSEFETRSKRILEEGFVEKNYVEFADGLLNSYLYRLLKPDYPFEEFSESILDDTYYLSALNEIRCEAHNEVIMTAIKQRLERRFKGEH